MIELNKIYCGDCLDLMQEVDTGSVDMILCDLPYEKTANPWDKIIDPEKMWIQYKRIIKDNGAIVLTAIQPFTSLLIMTGLDLFAYEWIWKKNKCSGHLMKGSRPLRNHESVLVFYKKQPPYSPQMTTGHTPMHYAKNGQSTNYKKYDSKESLTGSTSRFPKTVLDFNVVNNDSKSRFHPNQKPVSLFEYLIRTYTKPGELVLDNAAGSSTTAEAAINTHRNFICIDKTEEYVIKAKRRLKNAEPQLF